MSYVLVPLMHSRHVLLSKQYMVKDKNDKKITLNLEKLERAPEKTCT
jgi:hypothetical protein